jgi:phosphonate transport system substrate-binding protein
MLLGRTRLGVIPFSEGGEERMRAFVAALESVFGDSIELHRAADYRALASAVEQGLVHFAWLPPLAAARAMKAGSITPAAVCVRHGTTSYYTGLIARDTSSIRSLDDLRGLRAAWVDRESASGYVVLRAALRQRGVSLVNAFSEDLFVRSHEEVVRAVATGHADVGATCFYVVSDAVEIGRTAYKGSHGLTLDNVRIVAEAGPIPSDIFAAHRSVPAAVVVKLQTALVGALPAQLYEAAKAMMFADSFARADGEHVRMLEALYDTVLGESAPRSVPPPKPPSFFPR